MIILDTGVLGLICHRSNIEEVIAAQNWLAAIRDRGIEVAIPEIADYEMRRSLIRLGSAESILSLDNLEADITYLAINTKVMRRAANLWAETRRAGRTTAPDAALDGDVIFAAQAIEMEIDGIPILAVSTNLRHLNWFVNTRKWATIDPADPELSVHIRRATR